MRWNSGANTPKQDRLTQAVIDQIQKLLVQHASRGDRLAIAKIIELSEPYLNRLLWKYSNSSWVELTDLKHAALLAIARKSRKYRPEIHPLAFLCKVTYSAVYSLFRKVARERERFVTSLLDEASEDSAEAAAAAAILETVPNRYGDPAELAIYNETLRKLIQALKKLSPRQSQIFWRTQWHYRDRIIARELDMTVESVRTTRFAVRNKLAAAIDYEFREKR
jgi:RNA polymerase sigma factor (sigma-70 family)